MLLYFTDCFIVRKKVPLLVILGAKLSKPNKEGIMLLSREELDKTAQIDQEVAKASRSRPATA